MSPTILGGTIERLPDGHRLYTRHYSGKTATYLIDDSGNTPETTDDGALRLDQARPLAIRKDRMMNEAEHFFIPLLDDCGNETRTESDATTLLLLSRRFMWHIEVEGVKPYMVNS